MPSIIAGACMLFVFGVGFFTLPLKSAPSACFHTLDK